MDESNISEMPDGQIADTLEHEKQIVETKLENNANHAEQNGFFDAEPHVDGTYDQLVQMVVELNLQNEYLKSQFEGLQAFHSESDRSNQKTRETVQEVGASVDVKELHVKIESLNREIYEERQTRVAAEEALKHLRAAYSEADEKAQELSTKLGEGQI